MRQVDIKVTPLQGYALQQEEKFLGLFGGVGNGKTRFLCNAIQQDALTVPNALCCIVRNTAPQLVSSTVDVYLKVLKQWDPSGKFWKFRESPKLDVTYYNGSTVLFRHAQNPDDFLGPNFTSVGFDQAEQIDEDIFTYSTGRIRREGGRNRIVVTGNPAGVDWVYRFFNIGDLKEEEMQAAIAEIGWHDHVSGETKDRRMITAPTVANIENLPPDYIPSMIRANGADWVKRFIRGSWFLTDSGIWDVSKVTLYTDLPKILGVYIGVDPAFSEEDAACESAIVAIGVGDDGYLYVLDVLHGKWRTAKLLEEMYNICKKYKPKVIGIESVAAQQTLIDAMVSMIDEFWPKDVEKVFVEGIKVGGKDKWARAKAVSYLVDHGKLRCNYKPLTEQMSSFAAEQTDDKDLVDALVHAMKMCQKYGPVIELKKIVDNVIFDPYYAINKSIIDGDKRYFEEGNKSNVTKLTPIYTHKF